MCVNNSWSLVRPNLWVGVDSPYRFLGAGWMDPSIMKILPMGHIDSETRLRSPEGEFLKGKRTRECPNVSYFVRDDSFDHLRFFEGTLASWGCWKQIDSLGFDGHRSVMLCAMKIAYWLGFERLYLVGCDFKMESGGPAYGFEEEKKDSARISNNRTYDVLQQRMAAMSLPRGFQVFNCNPQSGLRCFPFVGFEEAIGREAVDQEWQLTTLGWYDEGKKK